MPLDHKLLTSKFEGLKNKQDKITVLSMFLIHNRKQVSTIIDVWLKVVKKSPAGHRLTLLYLANDVVQHAKKKGHVTLVDGFQKVITASIPYFNDSSIKSSVSRVFSIWAERSIYPVAFIVDLKKKLGEGNPLKESAITSKIVAEYKLSSLLECIKRVHKVEEDVKSKVNCVNSSNITKLSNEILAGLKDKSVAEELTSEFDAATVILVDAISSLEKEVVEKRKLLEELSKSLVFYVIQRKEVEQLSDAYKKLGSNVATIKKRASGQSSVPSPVKDVPSPSDSDDGPVLPSDNAKDKTSSAPVSTLDQRLTLLMQGALESGVAPPQSINPNFRTMATATTTTAGHPSTATGKPNSGQPPQPPLPTVSKIQTIQSVITPRTDQDLIQSTDMDITNSDEEDIAGEYTPRLPPPMRAVNTDNIIPLHQQPNRNYSNNNNHGGPPSMYLPPPPPPHPMHHQQHAGPRSVVVPSSNTTAFIPPHHGQGGGHMSHQMDYRSGPSSWAPPAPHPSPSRDMDNRRGGGGPPQRPPTPERISRMVSQYRTASSAPSSGRQPSANSSRR